MCELLSYLEPVRALVRVRPFWSRILGSFLRYVHDYTSTLMYPHDIMKAHTASCTTVIAAGRVRLAPTPLPTPDYSLSLAIGSTTRTPGSVGGNLTVSFQGGLRNCAILLIVCSLSSRGRLI